MSQSVTSQSQIFQSLGLIVKCLKLTSQGRNIKRPSALVPRHLSLTSETISGMSARKRTYYQEISAASKKITTLVFQSQKLFRAKEKSKEWEAYLVYIDEIVIQGLLKAVAASIGYLLDETDPSLTQGILLEVKFELNEPDVIFNPPLEKNIVGNVHDKVKLVSYQ